MLRRRAEHTLIRVLLIYAGGTGTLLGVRQRAHDRVADARRVRTAPGRRRVVPGNVGARLRAGAVSEADGITMGHIGLYWLRGFSQIGYWLK